MTKVARTLYLDPNAFPENQVGLRGAIRHKDIETGATSAADCLPVHLLRDVFLGKQDPVRSSFLLANGGLV